LFIWRLQSAGPGNGTPGFYVAVALFCVQIVTIWVSICLLPSSEKKGLRTVSAKSIKRRFPLHDQSDGRYEALAKLRTLIVVDAIIFWLIVIIAVVLLFVRPYNVLRPGAFWENEWLLRQVSPSSFIVDY
jgi:hypothetical protein